MIATFMILTGLSPLALSEEGFAVEMEQRLAETRARLNLTDAQLDQMVPVIENSRARQQQILARYGIDLQRRNDSASRLGLRQARAMREEMDVVRTDTLNALEGILSEAQLVEFKRIQEERKAEMRKRIRGGRS
jgi:hypothetical protein